MSNGPAGNPDAWSLAVGTGHDLLGRKARTFRLAAAMLPRSLQDDIAVLYAFCRVADDLADERADPDELDALDAELAGSRAPRPIVASLMTVAARHGFSLQHAHTLLDGVRSDLGTVRMEDDAELLGYSFKVASTVGLMMSRVLGVREAAAELHAADLGLAMQLTNIVRDVREDAAHGRVYLPRTRLADRGITPDDVLAGRGREAVRDVCLDLLALADKYYASGRRGFRFIPARHRVAVAVAGEVYGAIGWRIRRTGHHPLDGRLVVPRAEKLGRVARALALSVSCSLDFRTGSSGSPHVSTHVARHRA